MAKKAAIIGGRKALAAAEPQIRKAVEGSGIEITGTFWYGGEASRETWICSGLRWRTPT